MMFLSLAASLVDLLPAERRASTASGKCMGLHASTWKEAIEQLREHFPEVANHIFDAEDSLQKGFVLVVNDEVVSPTSKKPTVRDGDRLTVIVALAGG